MKPFEAWPEIEQFFSYVCISEKCDGTNAQIDIEGEEVLVGSRSRWLTPEDDNFGFAKKVQESKDELIKSLGQGKHFGEWMGSGVGRNYGMTEKRFVLFNATRWTQPKKDGLLPSWVDVVPVLYSGPYKEGIVTETMSKLKETGSIIAPGFMRPEGIVIYFSRADLCFKYVFEAETTPSKPKEPKLETPEDLEAYKFLQPIRLDKLFVKEEFLLKQYPVTLPKIVEKYLTDLIKETDPVELTPDRLKVVKRKVFVWIKEELKNKGYT